MRRWHAISPGFSCHYRELECSSATWHDSACDCVLSVVTLLANPRSGYIERLHKMVAEDVNGMVVSNAVQALEEISVGGQDGQHNSMYVT